jgi:hypothetical protein
MPQISAVIVAVPTSSQQKPRRRRIASLVSARIKKNTESGLLAKGN